ncbi:v-SNARE family protein [Dictyostelium purpureum]|uniref:V-SNARE family protein n=1 Tax=Dictyostelium purpureum TaxID=5786 RepID=F0ZQD3_DICPU|nr:v-SNARE family protein [Dictyostelium purpureum]EGC33843.1 v-SNARE family protein [Dictyostelium purpureum]|eukprot:XP_003289633.1 v-SNARE family protein [Dictyostelium purpureum]
MDNFERTEQNFQHVCNTLTRRIKQLPNFGGERKKVAIREAETDIDEALRYISEMEKIAQNHSQRVRLQAKVKQYQQDIQKYKRELQLAQNTSSNSVNNPFLSGPEDYQSQYDNQRQHLLSGSNMLDSTSDRLLRTHQISEQNQQIGENILMDLGKQGQQLRGMRDKLDETDDNIKSARKIMTGMARRLATNKVILSFIILLLLGIIALIICLKWLR